MLRSLAFVPALTVGLTMPAAAQQISQQDAEQAAKGVTEAYFKALHAKDAQGVAALYSEDAIRVGPLGERIGRAQIEQIYAQGLKTYDPEFNKVDRVMVISNDVILSFNSWGGINHGPNGPENRTGYTVFTLVRGGAIWRIRAETFNISPQKGFIPH
jgi:uncharacterized protein (TIGR02246 family)